MKVLFLSWNFPPTMGGMEYVAANLFEGLCAGHQVRALVPRADGEPARAGVERAPGRGIRAYVRFVFARGWQLCRRERPDVMLCVSVLSGLPAVVLSKVFRIPVVILVHGSDVLHPGFLYQRVIRWVLRSATRIAANSGQTKRFMTDAGFDGERIDVIYPGVRVEDFLRTTSGGADEIVALTAGRKVVLTVGRLIRRKGVLPFVAEVMPELVKRHPDVLYLVVGDDARQSLVHHERLRDQIAACVAAKGLGAHVRLMGAVSSGDLMALYRRAHLFVLPCLDIPGDVEGFGIVFSEAALAGIPSVATRVGGIPEAIVDGETGVLVEPGDFKAMTKVIGDLLADDARSRQLAEAGKQRAIRELGWDVITKRYVKHLEQAVAGRSRVGAGAARNGRGRWWRGVRTLFFGLVVAAVTCEIGARYELVRRDQRVSGAVDRSDVTFWIDDSRLHPFVAEDDTNAFRITVIGDSFAIGQDCYYGDTFGARLESLLNLNPGVRPVRVDIRAEAGTGTREQRRLLGKALTEGRPDLVILAYCLNDTEDWAKREEFVAWRKAWDAPEPGRIVGRLCGVSALADLCFQEYAERRVREGFQAYFRKLYNPSYSGLGRMESAMTYFRDVCRTNGVGFVVVLLPVFDVGGSNAVSLALDTVKGVASRLDVPLLDLWPVFEGKDSFRMTTRPGKDGHMNEIAHRIAAEEIFMYLLANDWVDKSYVPIHKKTHSGAAFEKYLPRYRTGRVVNAVAPEGR